MKLRDGLWSPARELFRSRHRRGLLDARKWLGELGHDRFVGHQFIDLPTIQYFSHLEDVAQPYRWARTGVYVRRKNLPVDGAVGRLVSDFFCDPLTLFE